MTKPHDCWSTGAYCYGPCARHGKPEPRTLWVQTESDDGGEVTKWERPVRLADGRGLILILTKQTTEPDGWTWTVSGWDRSFETEYDAHRETMEACRDACDAWARVVANGVASRCLQATP